MIIFNLSTKRIISITITFKIYIFVKTIGFCLLIFFITNVSCGKTNYKRENNLWANIHINNLNNQLCLIDTLTEFKKLVKKASGFEGRFKHKGIIINEPQLENRSQAEIKILNMRKTAILGEYCLYFTNNFKTFRLFWIKDSQVFNKVLRVKDKIRFTFKKISKGDSIAFSKRFCNNTLRIININSNQTNEVFLPNFWCFPNPKNNIRSKEYKNADHNNIFRLLLLFNKLKIFTDDLGLAQFKSKNGN